MLYSLKVNVCIVLSVPCKLACSSSSDLWCIDRERRIVLWKALSSGSLRRGKMSTLKIICSSSSYSDVLLIDRDHSIGFRTQLCAVNWWLHFAVYRILLLCFGCIRYSYRLVYPMAINRVQNSALCSQLVTVFCSVPHSASMLWMYSLFVSSCLSNGNT